MVASCFGKMAAGGVPEYVSNDWFATTEKKKKKKKLLEFKDADGLRK